MEEKCDACLEVASLGDAVSVETTGLLLRALRVPPAGPEDVEGGGRRRGLRICGDCTSAFTKFTGFLIRSEERSEEFYGLWRRLGRGVLRGWLRGSEETVGRWEKEVFPSSVEVEEEEIRMELEEEPTEVVVGGGGALEDSKLRKMRAVVLLERLEETSLVGDLQGESVTLTSGEEESTDLKEIGGEKVTTPKKRNVSSRPRQLFPEVSPLGIRRSSRSCRPKRYSCFQYDEIVRSIPSRNSKARGANLKSQAPRIPKRGKICSSKRNVARHLRDSCKRGASVREECLQCWKSFSRAHDLSRHVRRFHAQGAAASVGVRASVGVGRPGLPFGCSLCSLFFRRKSQLFNHRRLAHNVNVIPLELKRRQCGICSRVFPRLQHLRLHEANVHSVIRERPETTTICCAHCDVTFRDPGIFKVHRLRRHFLGSTEDGVAQCPKCLKFFHDRSAMERHQNQNHSTEDIRCFLCRNSPTFSTSAELKTHEESEEHVKKIRSKGAVHCNVCRLNFGENTEALQVHLNSPQHLKEVDTLGKFDEATFCVPCRQNFDNWELLVAHNNSSVAHEEVCQFRENAMDEISPDAQLCEENETPTAETPTVETPVDVPVNCDLCGMTFKYQRRLNRHIRKWHTPPNENCRICGVAFLHLMDFHRHYLPRSDDDRRSDN